MAPIATCRCPSCGVLNPVNQSICIRCLGPLGPDAISAPDAPVTGETSVIYRARSGTAMLLFSASALEYSGEAISFSTIWSNVASISHAAAEDLLWLYQTPQQIKMPLSSSQEWFSDHTRTIPLRQFGYPYNSDLASDLAHYAPQLQRYLRI